jgi:hypothetical protein
MYVEPKTIKREGQWQIGFIDPMPVMSNQQMDRGGFDTGQRII